MANSISGNAGIAGALVVIVGKAASSTTSAGDGSYSFAGLAAGTYYVLCQMTGKKFSPWTSTQTIVSSNITGVNFVASAASIQTPIWHKQGVVLPPNTTQLHGGAPVSGTLEPTIIYEGNAQILSGNVFKAWFTGGGVATTINYAESTDGISWTQYSGNPVIAAHCAGRVFKNGSTYYGYFQNSTNDTGGPTDLYTSSDGVSWSLAHSSVLTAGAAGTWDATGIWNFTVVDIVGGVWRALYNSQPANNEAWYVGLATSSDGIVWIKSPSNPVIANFVNPNVHKVGNTYYAWGDTTVFGLGGSLPFNYPTTLSRSSSTDLISWTAPTPSIGFTQLWEGALGGNSQLDSPAVVEANGKTYMFYSGGPTCAQGTSFQLGLAIANMPLDVIVSVQDGEALGLQTATDNFQRANENPLSDGGQWASSVSHALQVSSNIAIGTAAAALNGASFIGVTWPNDQYSEVTAGPGFKAGAGSNFVVPAIRVGGTTANPAYYIAAVQNNGTVFIEKSTTGTPSVLKQLSITVTDGDVYRLVAIGSTISFFQNGVCLWDLTDTALASGKSGFIEQAAATLALTPVTLWSGGTPAFGISGSLGLAGAGATISWTGTSSGSVTADSLGNYSTFEVLLNGNYTISSSLAGYTFSPANSAQTINGADITGVNFTATPITPSVYSVPDCRVSPFGPNASRTIQGTVTYDVQTSSNPAIPPTDSRVAGAPVDSRVNPNIPQNSRTNPPF